MTIDAVKDQPGAPGQPRQVACRVDPQHVVDVPSLRARTRDLLLAHVPLTLLLDLADPDGPDSAGRYLVEGGDVGWLRVG